MAFFRNTSFLTGICKGTCSSLFNTPNRTYSELTRRPFLMSNKSPFSSIFPVRRHPSSILQNYVSSLENAMALGPQTLWSPTSRGFHSTTSLRQNEQNDKTPTFGEQMSLRLINENGFLSWTRNSYLSAAVGATMLNGGNVDVVQHAGILVLVVSGMNMAWGSSCHFINLLRIRDRCAMSRPTLFLNLLGCVVHALLWLFILGYYIHFSGHTGWIRHRRRQHQEIISPVPNKEQ